MASNGRCFGLHGRASIDVDDAPLQGDIDFMDGDIKDKVFGTNLRRPGMVEVADMEEYVRGGAWGHVNICKPIEEDDQNIERHGHMGDNVGNESMVARMRQRKRIV